MEILRPVPPQTPDYPGFHHNRRLLQQFALFLRLEITLPICLFLTLSCAQLHAETPSAPAGTTVEKNQTQGAARDVAFDPAIAEAPCSGNVQEAPPPCRGDVVEFPEKRRSALQFASHPSIIEAPCSGKVAAPPNPIEPQSSPCTGESAAPPPDSCTGFAPQPEPQPQPQPPGVPCAGAPPVTPPNGQVVLPASSYKDLSLVDAQKKPGDYIGMRVRLQGFVGNNPPGSKFFIGYYLASDLPTGTSSDFSGLQLLGTLPALEVGGRAIVEGTIVRVDTSRSGLASYAIQVQNVRTK